MVSIQRLFARLQAVSPRLAGGAALFLFTHPLPPAIRSDAEKRLTQRARRKLVEAEHSMVRAHGYRIATYRFAHSALQRRGTVLLVHGWTSAAAFMTAPVEHLRALGYDVVAFDLPAHGKSSGRKAEMMDCALVLGAVATRHGPIDQVIAHSFGGPVTTLALASDLSPGLTDETRLHFIASPNRLADVTAQFAAALGLSRETQTIFESAVVAPFGVDLDAMDGNLLLGDRPNPITILHSRDDLEVTYDAAEKFARLGKQVQLRTLDGLGHRRILHARPSMEALVEAVTA
ncbi:alpha/beta hydrolase [Aurantiacibacter marinus]|uniref:alpha/beta hydrolase n=1 Tax=Aurantiacibacter marinus TaxID=874156 RepID=UPI000699EAF8|nr:alpha/beta fold hydrolase [Aurantiacibacter marinus]